MSAILLTSPYTYSRIPVAAAILRPPAADMVSVQPGKGSLIDALMIEGLNMTTGILAGRLFLKVLSVIDFVNV